MINIFYLSGNTTGGWVTFTYHLIKSLEAQGEDTRLFKIGKTTERTLRPFGYDLHYQNISLENALRLEGVALIAAAAKNFREAAARLIENGARLVLHDPTELKAGLAGLDIDRPWVIRKEVAKQVPNSVFIRHPYVRHRRPAKPPRRSGVISTSRIDFDKNTTMILDANRLGAKIKIHGFENRLYTRFKVCPHYPEWEQSKAAYPRTPDAAFELLLGAQAMVDLSDIKGDGGGTQYTFLEAWDAGTRPIIGDWWLRKSDDMQRGKNCHAVGDARELAALIKQLKTEPEQYAEFNYDVQLRRHAPKIIIPQVMEWLNAS